MGKLKSSKYNIIHKNENDEILIVNGLYDTCIKFDRELSKEITNILNQPEIELNNKIEKTSRDLLDFLCKQNILVNINCEEDQMVDFEYNKMAYGDKTLRLTIIPTDACNFKCVYCYEEENNHYMSEKSSDCIIKFLQQNLKNFGSLRIAWFGGEPLLAINLIIPFLKKVKKIANFYKVPFVSEMTTNGYFLTQSLFEELFECGVVSYQITMDGFKNIHNAMRPMKCGGDSYTVIYENLLNIKNNTSKRAVILIRVNFNFDYKKETVEFIKHIQDVFLDDKRFLLNVQGIRDWGGNRITSLNITPFPNYDEIFENLISINIDPTGGIADFKQVRDICSAAKTNYYFINWDLSVHKCSLALNHGGEPLGYLSEQGRMIIDKRKEMNWTKRNNISKSCYDCQLYPFCMANICPYVFNVKNQIRCEDFKFSFFNKIKSVEKTAKVIHPEDIY